jgi:hypothetical protein
MSFLAWLAAKAGWPAEPEPPEQPQAQQGEEEDSTLVNLPGPGTYAADVVGESHYQDALDAICC